MSSITAYCRITETACTINGQVIQQKDLASEEHWFKQLYKVQQLAYPKFHKMDLLAQGGVIASELIKRTVAGLSEKYGDDEVALVFANKSSSADTDLRFTDSYVHHGAPSPSLFVYTLPNIALGEIAILNKWYGENMFAVLPKFEPDFFVNYTLALLAGSSQAALCGWIEVMENRIDVMLFLVEKNQSGHIVFNSGNLADLYHTSTN